MKANDLRRAAAPPALHAPYADAAAILVTGVGAAEGSRGAAAALACAGADVDRAALLVELGGRPPRPTLLASAAAQRLEERLAAHLPELRVAARGQICHLSVAADPDGFELTAAAATVVRGAAGGGRGATTVIHLDPNFLQPLLHADAAPGPTGSLLRADLAADRELLALATRDLRDRGLAIAVLKHRLAWVAERRALFGALPPEAPGGLPSYVLERLLGRERYSEIDDKTFRPPQATTKSWRRDHAGARRS